MTNIKIIVKCIVFFLVCFLPFLVQMVYPIDFFNFRVWESISYYRLKADKPFYSNINIEKVEEGDLGHGTDFSVGKKVIWQTDEYGYRNTPNKNQTYDIVIVGDSAVVGTGLSQNETLSSVLMTKTGLNVYSLATADINKFISDRRFNERPPKTVIIESVERYVYRLPEVDENVTIEYGFYNPIIQSIIDRLDSLLKMNLYRYYFSKMFGTNSQRKLIVNDKTKMLFFEQSIENEKLNLDNLNSSSRKIISYNEYFKKRGIKFMFLLVPDKETVYSDQIPIEYNSTKTDKFIKNLQKNLNVNNITVIDVFHYFKLKRDTDTLYQPDDTHWNQKGIDITTDLIFKQLVQIRNIQ